MESGIKRNCQLLKAHTLNTTTCQNKKAKEPIPDQIHRRPNFFFAKCRIRLYFCSKLMVPVLFEAIPVRISSKLQNIKLLIDKTKFNYH